MASICQPSLAQKFGASESQPSEPCDSSHQACSWVGETVSLSEFKADWWFSSSWSSCPTVSSLSFPAFASKPLGSWILNFKLSLAWSEVSAKSCWCASPAHSWGGQCLSPLTSEQSDLLWGVTASYRFARGISPEIGLIIWGEYFLFSKLSFEVTATRGFEMQLQALVLAFCSVAFFQFGEIAFLLNQFFSLLLVSVSPCLASSGNYGDWPLSPYPAYWFSSSDFLHRKQRWEKTGRYKRRGERKGERDWFPRSVGLCLYYW